MPNRLHREAETTTRQQWIDRLTLPAVTVLLLVGAVFVVIAWSEADNAVQSSHRKDEARATRLAGSVERVLQRRWLDLSRWADDNAALVVPGKEQQLRSALEQQVDAGASSTAAAWLVVREDGAIAAVGEATPGRIAANGIADDLRALGRTTAARGTPQVSDRLKIGEEYVYASAVPVPAVSEGAPASAVVAVTYLERSSIGSFLGDQGEGEVDEATLVDGDERVLLGAPHKDGVELVRRPVGSTGWSVEFQREALEQFLPGWAYPGFAAILAIFALAYAAQDLNRRRLRSEADDRAHRVNALYELASRALHAETIAEQAELLAVAATEIGDVEAATVVVHTGEETIEHAAGDPGAGPFDRELQIEGPRGELGRLTVRDAEEIDDARAWVLETAAALVGAAVETLVSLESQRAVAQELQRLDELRSNLLATVAHELLSPLTAVKGVLGLLSMQDDLGERGREFVDVATERTDRLVALIRNLFDCSLLETGQLDIKPRRQRADELLEAALGAQAAARPGELRLSATPNLMITVDPVRFDQLVNNLVTNAFRHGAPPVEVAVRPGDGGAFVMVSDEGAGIPPESRDEVFGKFWQGSSGHAREAEGAGLGLSLVQGLVRVHGGDITIDSTHADGRGARFVAFFPDEAAASDGLPSDDMDATPTLA